jgi:hypothetical protein
VITYQEAPRHKGETARFAVRSRRKLIGFVFCHQQTTAQRHTETTENSASSKIVVKTTMAWGCQWLNGDMTTIHQMRPTKRKAAELLTNDQYNHLIGFPLTNVVVQVTV